MNVYLQECLAEERLDEARALMARWRVVRGLRPARPPVRVRAGLALIKAGRWLARTAQNPNAEPGRVKA